MAACPYGVRVFNWGEPKHIPEHPVGFQGEVKDEGWVIYTPKRPRGVVEKCTMCIHRIIVGEEPFCVAMCPARARFFGDLDNPNSKVSRLIKERSGVRLLEELGTQPKTYYLPPRRGRQAFANIDEIVAEYVKSTLTNIVVTSKDIALQAIAASTLKRVSNNV
jgi:molybdopterin-containing oxidoreductase family iron-sulfur binding subunit